MAKSLLLVAILAAVAVSYVNAQCVCPSERRGLVSQFEESDLVVRVNVERKRFTRTWQVRVLESYKGCTEIGKTMLVLSALPCKKVLRKRKGEYILFIRRKNFQFVFSGKCSMSGHIDKFSQADINYMQGTPDARCAGRAPFEFADYDLMPMQSYLSNSLTITRGTFSEDSCEVVEKCVMPGPDRKLLQFDGAIANVGSEDLVLGDPSSLTSGPAFEFSPCHQHYHFIDFAEYSVYNESGLVAEGHKQAFCLMDSTKLTGKDNNPKYECDYQGIQAGWFDNYPAGLPCQWVDITDLADGVYTLYLDIDPTNILKETNRNNNRAEARFMIEGEKVMAL